MAAAGLMLSSITLDARSAQAQTAATATPRSASAPITYTVKTGDSFNAIFAMADMNKDGMVTKQEFLDAMGKQYDMKMAKMKAGKDADKMVKGTAMTMEGMRSLINDIHSGA
jgi:hypothetical protein